MDHAQITTASHLNSQPITTGWSAQAVNGPVPENIAGRTIAAQVPGMIHLDLLKAGLIDDPYLDDNEALQSWIGLSDFTYRTTFSVDADQLQSAEHHELEFLGLDTVAKVLLNGAPILSSANQHRSYRIEVTELLRQGENELMVNFRSPVKYANEQSAQLGMRPRPYPLPYDAIRKSACSFGWDWGIETASSGIWKPVNLLSWSTARLEQVLVSAHPDGDGGSLRVDASVNMPAPIEGLELVVAAHGEEVRVSVSATGQVQSAVLNLEKVEKWWPTGYGEQALYDVEVSLCASRTSVDSVNRRVGFRTVRWEDSVDEAGTQFQLLVNDQPVYVKGANWIPDDAFPVRVDADRYRTRLGQAKDAGLNLIRVWGGGIYESDDFFNACDELGLLTWQDFLFACAAYSEEEPLRGEVIAEARDNVARLAHHASLVMLCGNNENLWGYEDWDWKRFLDGKSWGGEYYRELLPQIVNELAAHVSYSPGSPFSPHGEHPNAEEHGTMHIWDLWNQRDWPEYRTYKPRFVAEFGWQGPAAWSTLTRSISDNPLTPESPGMVVHQKAMEGNAKLTTGLVAHYPLPADMEDWHWAMQLNQANAISCALDHFRSLAPHNSGAIVWQLNDCWPVTSWAAIDGDGVEKPLFHALRNSFAPRAITVQPHGDALAVILSNDTHEQWSGELDLSRRGYDGTELDGTKQQVTVPPRGNLKVEIPASVGTAGSTSQEVLVASVGQERGLWFYAEARETALEAPQLETSIQTTDEALVLQVMANNLVRDLCVLADKVNPEIRVDRGLITLLPGESTSFILSHAEKADPALLVSERVVRSANQLIHRS